MLYNRDIIILQINLYVNEVMTMREEEKIKAGILFSPADAELKAIKLKAHNLNNDYNATYEDD